MPVPRLSMVIQGSLSQASAHVSTTLDWFEQWADLLRELGFEPHISTDRPSGATYSRNSWRRLVNAVEAAVGAQEKYDFMIGVNRDLGDYALARLATRSVHPDVAELAILMMHPRDRSQVLVTTGQFVELAIDACERSGLSQGLLLRDDLPKHSAGTTPVEREARPNSIFFGPNALERYVRGPGWGLWLTTRHIDLLGGIERMKAEAPVLLVEPRGEGVWLQLTLDPWAVTEEALERFADYLKPLTPTVELLRLADSQPLYHPEPPQFSLRPRRRREPRIGWRANPQRDASAARPGARAATSMSGSEPVASTGNQDDAPSSAASGIDAPLLASHGLPPVEWLASVTGDSLGLHIYLEPGVSQPAAEALGQTVSVAARN